MLMIALVMLAILAVAGLVMAFVAYPLRGEALPAAPWLGQAMGEAARRAPVIDDEDEPVLSRR